MVRIKSILFIAMILFISSCSESDTQPPEAQEGILDLTGISPDEMIRLNGDWKFRNLPVNDGQRITKEIMKVPGNWNRESDTTYKSGEYRLKIILPPDYPVKGALLFPELSQIMILKVNGETVFESGDWISGRTDYTRKLIPVNLTEETHISIYLKNVMFRTGGLHHAPLFGTHERIQRYKIFRLWLESVNIGILFFIFLYYTFLFSRHYINQSAAFLAIAALGIMFRGFITGENTIIYLLPDFLWNWDYNLEYLSIYISSMSLLLFAYLCYPLKSKVFIIILKFFIISGILLSIISMLLPIKILSRTIWIVQIYIIVMFLLQLFIIFEAIKGRKQGSFLFLFGGTTFVILAVLDSLYYHGLNAPINISQLGMLVFILTQAFNQSRIYGDAYLRAEKLTHSLEEEVSARTKDLESVNQSLKEEILIRKRTEEELHYLSTTDSLTKLANRYKINDELQKAHNLFIRYNLKYSIIMFDLDYFKNINDTYGHDAGDAVLQKISFLTSEVLRDCDILSRWGGEEFLILLPETPLTDALTAAQRIRKAIISFSFSKIGQVTASFGVVESETGETEPSEILKRVDQLLYKAKENGRDRIES